MPVLAWFAQLLRAVVRYAVHLGICTGLFLLSAYFATRPDPDERNATYFFRAVGAIWLFIATWNFVAYGVLGRPRPVPDRSKAKPSGAEAARGAVGCLGRVALMAATYVVAGRAADWAWAGISGPDPQHPARRAVDRLLADAPGTFDRALPWVPWMLAGLALFTIAKAIVGASRRNRRHRRQDALARNEATLKRLPEHVRTSNDSTLQRLRKRRPTPATRPVPEARHREILAAAGAASAATVGAAHAGAHRADASRVASGAAREDRVLGALSWSSADGAWWANRPDGGFPVRIDGSRDAPDPQALETARHAVQRSFEALLRASEVVRPAAQARGVGLPRFSIGAVRVAPGTPPTVTLHLQCDSDSGHEYVVRSTDGLNTFLPA